MSTENESFRLQIGQRIQAARKEVGFSQDDLASRANISRVTLSRYERGELTPPADVLSAIVSALGPNMKADWLLFGFPADVEEHPIRLPSFGTVTALHFDGAGTADVLLDLTDIKKMLDTLAVLENQRETPEKSTINAINQIRDHFSELEYSEEEEFTLTMIAEAMIAVNGVQLTPIVPIGIRGNRQNQLTPEMRFAATKPSRKAGNTKVKQSIKGKENQVAGRDIVFKNGK